MVQYFDIKRVFQSSQWNSKLTFEVFSIQNAATQGWKISQKHVIRNTQEKMLLILSFQSFSRQNINTVEFQDVAAPFRPHPFRILTTSYQIHDFRSFLSFCRVAVRCKNHNRITFCAVIHVWFGIVLDVVGPLKQRWLWERIFFWDPDSQIPIIKISEINLRKQKFQEIPRRIGKLKLFQKS